MNFYRGHSTVSYSGQIVSVSEDGTKIVCTPQFLVDPRDPMYLYGQYATLPDGQRRCIYGYKDNTIMLNAPFDSFPLSREVSFTVPETVPLDADESWWEVRRVLS